MKKHLFVLFIFLAAFAAGSALFFFGGGTERAPKSEDNRQELSAEFRTYESEKFAFRFSYPPNYFLEEKKTDDGKSARFSIVLTEDTEENRSVREGKSPAREGPISVTFEVFQNPETLSLSEWVKKDPLSNYHLSGGATAETTFGGFPALSYSWDGLYLGDSVAALNRGRIFLASVTYLSPEDAIRRDFSEMVRTFQFR